MRFEEKKWVSSNGFHLHSSPFFLFFFIFYGCISFLHELIPFSRALDVVCL